MVAGPELENNYHEDESTDDIVLEFSSTNDASSSPISKRKNRNGGAGSNAGHGAPHDADDGDGTAQESSDSSLWLVKSGEQILGPFRTEEVIEKVRSRELVVIDEIAAPSSRWRYLRDEPSFALVVEETRRAQMATREDTEVQMGGMENFSAQGGTSTDSASLLNHRSPTSHETHAGPSPHDAASSVQEGEFTEEVIRPGSSTKPEENVSGRQFGVSQDRAALATSLERRSRFIWLLTLLIVAGIGGFLIKENPPVANHVADNAEAFKQALFEGEAAWSHGDLTQALGAYRRADELIPGNPDVTVRLAPLMMKIEGQTVAAKRSLQDLLARTADAKLQREAQMGLGLAALYAEDFNDADKVYQALLAANPVDAVVLYNSSVARYLRRDYKAAALGLTETLRANQDLAPATILLALSYMNQGGENLKNASEVLETYLASHFDYRQEAQILETYIILARGNKMQALAQAGMALESDPYLTSEHLHDPWMDLDPLSASKILVYVQKIHAGLSSSTTQALLAIFQAKAKQTGEAEKTLADALAAKPSNADLLAADAFVLMQTGRDADAKATLSLARKDGSKLAWVLTGRNCQNLHEAKCESEAWAKLVAFNPPALVALIGHAQENLSRGETALAQQDLVKTESLSPHYLPAIRMREKVSGQ